MNKLFIFSLKICRKIFTYLSTPELRGKPECEQDADKTAQFIYDSLMSDKPYMVARFGSTELTCLANYVGITQHKNNILGYIKGESKAWWWDDNIANQMQKWSGFFPARANMLEMFCKLMKRDISEVDMLGSWLEDERLFEQELQGCQKVNLELLNPYFSRVPWTKALAGKKVLVVHPFAETIKKQYRKRELIFKNDLLPQFDLITIQAVQSLGGNASEFKDWFDALNFMKAEIDKHDYDVCLIGCGAYGFPLAAHVKRTGKKSIHLGGSLQLLFGISGKRWENPNYNDQYNYSLLMNEHWTKPDETEKPDSALQVEDACYW